MTLDVDIVTTQDPGGRLVLVADVQRVIEPVLDISAPLHIHRQRVDRLWDVGLMTDQKGALEINIHILKPGDVHDRVDVVGGVGGEDNLAALTALLEGIDNGRGIVSGVGAAGGDHTGGCQGLLDEEQQSESRRPEEGHVEYLVAGYPPFRPCPPPPPPPSLLPLGPLGLISTWRVAGTVPAIVAMQAEGPRCSGWAGRKCTSHGSQDIGQTWLTT